MLLDSFLQYPARSSVHGTQSFVRCIILPRDTILYSRKLNKTFHGMIYPPDMNVYNRQVRNKNVNNVLERLVLLFKGL